MALLDEFDKLIVRCWSATVVRGEAGSPKDVQQEFVRRNIEVGQHGDTSVETQVRVIGQRMFVLRARHQQIG